MPLDTSNSYLFFRQVTVRLGVATDTTSRWKRNADFPAPITLDPQVTRSRLDDIIFEASLQTCFTMQVDLRLGSVAFMTGAA